MKLNVHKDSQVQKNINEYRKLFFKSVLSKFTEKDLERAKELLLQLNSDFLFVSISNGGKKLSIIEVEFLRDEELSENLRTALENFRTIIEAEAEDEEEYEETSVIAEAMLRTILSFEKDDVRIWYTDSKLSGDFYRAFGMKPHEQEVMLVKVKNY